MSKITIIISGGAIQDEFALSVLDQYESKRIIGVDKGVEFLYRHQIQPEYIVGDFDSISEEVIRYYREETNVPIREYNPVKDASDTEIAIRLAITLGCDRMIILGGTGCRIDHIWANVQSLEIAKKAGVEAEILDSCNRIRLCSEEIRLRKKDAFGTYFSLFPFGGEVENLTIRGAKYPLTHHHLLPNDSLCVSNEIEEEELVITFSFGTVILMETRDE
nr:thiamine diphosphokinase [uncultured Sellimonas sp.]